MSIGGGHLHSDDNTIRAIDVCVVRYGRQYDAIEGRIGSAVDDGRRERPSAFLDCTDESVLYDRSVG